MQAGRQNERSNRILNETKQTSELDVTDLLNLT